jgi:hypothetical protein
LLVVVHVLLVEAGDQRAVRVADQADRGLLAGEVAGGVRGAGDPAGDRVLCASVPQLDVLAPLVRVQPCEPCVLLRGQLAALPLQFGALAR